MTVINLPPGQRHDTHDQYALRVSVCWTPRDSRETRYTPDTHRRAETLPRYSFTPTSSPDLQQDVTWAITSCWPSAVITLLLSSGRRRRYRRRRGYRRDGRERAGCSQACQASYMLCWQTVKHTRTTLKPASLWVSVPSTTPFLFFHVIFLSGE